MNGSNFQIEQQCPQCGAPIILDEADRILSCKFCRTRVYLSTEDHFRFYLTPAEGIPEDIFFVPYWRINGLSYTIEEKDLKVDHQNSLFSYNMTSNIRELDISYKYFDVNFLSLNTKLMPHSLGLRPQAMKLKFAGSIENAGKFLQSSPSSKGNVVSDYQKRTGSINSDIFIGETASVIYTPVYFAKGRIHDAILKKPYELRAGGEENEQTYAAAPEEKWHVDFIPLLCPNCGADLPGEKDTLVVFCSNCNCALLPSNKNFTPVKFLVWQEKRKEIIYLPFWQLKVRVSNIQLETYADLIKLANLPKVPSEKWKQTPFYFCTPAFKINPSLYLRWCKQITATPAPMDLVEDFPQNKIYPVTLPVMEALETSPITITGLLADKRPLMSNAPQVSFTLEDACLVLHPFEFKTRELVHTKLGFAMDINALNLGAYL